MFAPQADRPTASNSIQQHSTSSTPADTFFFAQAQELKVLLSLKLTIAEQVLLFLELSQKMSYWERADLESGQTGQTRQIHVLKLALKTFIFNF